MDNINQISYFPENCTYSCDSKSIKAKISKHLSTVAKIVVGVGLVVIGGAILYRQFSGQSTSHSNNDWAQNALHLVNREAFTQSLTCHTGNKQLDIALLAQSIKDQKNYCAWYGAKVDKNAFALVPISTSTLEAPKVNVNHIIYNNNIFKKSSRPICQDINLDETVIRILTQEDPLKIIAPELTHKQALKEGSDTYSKTYRNLLKCGLHPDNGIIDPVIKIAGQRLLKAKNHLDSWMRPQNACSEVYFEAIFFLRKLLPKSNFVNSFYDGTKAEVLSPILQYLVKVYMGIMIDACQLTNFLPELLPIEPDLPLYRQALQSGRYR